MSGKILYDISGKISKVMGFQISVSASCQEF
jgi:hypothetical protein